jgi:hypothetical protein
MGNLRDLAWGARAIKPAEQFDQVFPAALGYHLDSSVDKIFRDADQAKLKRVAPNPPPETNPLNPAAHPHGQPGLRT